MHKVPFKSPFECINSNKGYQVDLRVPCNNTHAKQYAIVISRLGGMYLIYSHEPKGE